MVLCLFVLEFWKGFTWTGEGGVGGVTGGWTGALVWEAADPTWDIVIIVILDVMIVIVILDVIIIQIVIVIVIMIVVANLHSASLPLLTESAASAWKFQH